MTAENAVHAGSAVTGRAISHPGVVLREAREAARLSQRELAEDLYLTLHYVEAIEQGAFDRLPGDTFVRGYLRSYARRVNVSEELILEMFVECRSELGADGRRRRPGESDGSNAQKVIWRVLAVVLCLLVILGALQFFGSDDESESEPAGVQAQLADQPRVRSAIGTDATPVFREVTEPEGSVSETVSESDTESSDNSDGTSPPQPAVDRFEQKDGSLEMYFYSDSWVQVKDASGKVLTYGLKRAGDTLSLNGESPYAIRIGNVSGTKLLFNGEEVDLAAYARSNIANFVLN